MPRVKIDYVVSFSSEDPDHPASNLLAWEVSKKKWLCKKGESSCSIVLQLTKAVKISSVHIGAYHSALVEVLVARSEKASDQFQVLVPSCVFVSPGESRRDAAVERVRSFSGAQLADGARSQPWDRVRVVCSQPYNKHCKYGLSFVHVDEPGDGPPTPAPPPPAPAAALPARLLALDPLSSDEDDFRPGELFAQHLLKSSDSQGSASDTGAQIRQATSKALKNIAESSTKLVKTPISKPSSARDSASTAGDRADRTRDTLLYTADDTRPHAKIDRVLERHKHQKERDDKPTAQAVPEQKERTDDSTHTSKEEKRTPKRKMSCSPPARDTPPSKRPHKHSGDSSSDRSSRKDEKRVKAQASSEENEREGSPAADPHTILRGVVLVLSGYENPERAHVRNTALALGARVQRDWGAGCTHLICAFPGTPKMRAARAAAGPALPVATAAWLRACAAERRRLPWRWFATAPAERRPRPQPPAQRSDTERRRLPWRWFATAPAERRPRPQPPAQRSDTECDTDDEIEKVVQRQKATRATAHDAPTPSPAPPPDGEQGSSTDEEGGEEGSSGEDAGLAGALPAFFDGYTFALDGAAAGAGPLARYVAAYGGLVLQAAELDADSAVHFALGGGGGRGARVTPRWLAACHAARRLLPPPPPPPAPSGERARGWN